MTLAFLVHNNPFQILESSELTAPYLCHDGQGESYKSLRSLKLCDKTQCEDECTKDAACKGFDFATAECIPSTCRLYPTNIPRTDGGSGKRKYCKRTESKK